MTDRARFHGWGAATAALLIAGVLGASPAAAAPPPGLYGATGVDNTDTAAPSNLYRINPDTGAATTIGPIGHSMTGLALDPTDGTLYGLTAAVSLSNTERMLLTIDPATGAGTVKASIGTNNIEDIAFDAQGRLFGWNETGDDLATIDKVSGAVANVGESGAGVTFGDGLAFDRDGRLHALLDGDAGYLWSVNPASGAITRGPRLSGSPNQTGASMTAATFGCGGTTLYSVVNDFGDPPTYLVTVDTARGEIASKGVTVTALDALEWVCAAAAPGGPGSPGAPASNRRCGNHVLGTAASERLAGTPFGDTITGFAGDDVIRGLAGADCLNGKGGRDTLRGGRGVDGLEGGRGDDRLFGGRGRGTLRGGTGADRLTGGSRGDVVEGNSGTDRLSGGAGLDELLGGPGADRILPGEGRDSVEAGRGDDRISARDGRRDVIDCGFGRDTVVARDPADRLTGCERG